MHTTQIMAYLGNVFISESNTEAVCNTVADATQLGQAVVKTMAGTGVVGPRGLTQTA